MNRVPGVAGRLRGRLRSLPLPALVVVGLLVLLGTGLGGLYAYRTYDYVQHDNDFCVSCHLMEEPFERFAESEHRGLGCKACHQPTLIERSTMGLTQFVDDPDSIGVHAEVPNRVCADCHIEGDPEKWTQIANSAGHRIHLESADTLLEGLRCVECHSTSVHEFAPVDRTCAQSECHSESAVQLGAMSELTIHCVACHGFSASAPGDIGSEAFADAMSPDRDSCLTCHEMRVLVALPDPDPHEGACAACHNPHTQATPAEADQSCATAACHQELDELSSHHVGVPDSVAADCMACHGAHDFFLDGSDCLSCHVDIYRDDPTVPRERRDSSAANEPTPAPELEALGSVTPIPSAPSGVASVDRAAAEAARHRATGASVEPIQEVALFRHSEHPEQECAECHSTAERHGELTVTTTGDCQACHHTEPVSADCARCHAESESTGDPYSVLQTVALSVSHEATRSMPFDHGVHAAESCATCHTEGLALAATSVDCASCHEEHHDPEASCVSCHVPVTEEAHPVEEVHVTCAGAGCHTDVPFEVVPRTRQVCLGCHQDLQDHRPDEPNCAECHALPDPGGGGA